MGKIYSEVLHQGTSRILGATCRLFLISQMPWKKRSNEQRRRRIQMSSEVGERLETVSPFLSLKFVKWADVGYWKNVMYIHTTLLPCRRLQEKWKPSRPNTLWKNCVVRIPAKYVGHPYRKTSWIQGLRTKVGSNSVMSHQKLSSSHWMWNICTKSVNLQAQKYGPKSFDHLKWMFLQQIWQNGLRWSTRSLMTCWKTNQDSRCA